MSERTAVTMLAVADLTSVSVLAGTGNFWGALVASATGLIFAGIITA